MFNKHKFIFWYSGPDVQKYGEITNVQYKAGQRLITVEWEEDGGVTSFRESYLLDTLSYTKKYPDSRYGHKLQILDSKKAALAHKIKHQFNR